MPLISHIKTFCAFLFCPKQITCSPSHPPTFLDVRGSRRFSLRSSLQPPLTSFFTGRYLPQHTTAESFLSMSDSKRPDHTEDGVLI